jgi:hypothetical protein
VGKGEGVDSLADCGEAVAAGGGEVFEEVERGQRIGFAGGDFGGRGVVEEFNQEDDEAANERGVGIGVKVEAAFAESGGEPDGGNTAKDAVGIRAGLGRERRVAAGSVDDESETLLKVVDGGEVFEQGLKFGGEGHGRRNWAGEAGPASAGEERKASGGVWEFFGAVKIAAELAELLLEWRGRLCREIF